MPQSPMETPFGTQEAFHAAFAELYPRLVSYSRRYGATFPEDIAQEVLLRHHTEEPAR